MRSSIQGLSWYVRRGLHHEAPGYFYRDVIGLPLYGHTAAWSDWADRGAMFIFRGGAAIEFELLKGQVDHEPYTRPEQATIIPILRSYDLAATLARLEAAGAPILADRVSADGRTVYFADPDGNVDAVRLAVTGEDDPIGRAAEAEYRSGGARVNGIAPMPPDILDIGWIELRVADVARETAFYRDVLGLELLRDEGPDGTVLYLGDLGRLEIRPGGRVETPVADRDLAPDMWMLRVHDVDAIVADLDAAGVHWINRPFEMTGGTLAYFADPEGHIVGIQSHGNDGRVQEIEPEARWRAGTNHLVAASGATPVSATSGA
jgi:predicted enzyme related to lactoylglutathione lyase